MQNKICERLTVPARASVGFTCIGAVAKLLSVLTTPLFTRLLTAEEYGLYSLYTTWLGIFSVLLTLGIGSSVLYRGMQRFSDERDGFLLSALFLSLGALFLGVLFYLCFSRQISRFLGLSLDVTLFLFMQIAADLSLSFYLAECRFRYKPLAYALPRLACDLLIPLSAYLLLMKTPHPETARIRALLCGTLLTALPLTLRLFRRGWGACKAEHFTFLLSFALPLFPHAAAGILLTEGGRAVVGRTLGKATLARFGIAVSLGGALSLLTVGINSALHPWVMRKIASGKKERLSPLADLLSLLLTLATALLLLISPELLSLLAPASYGSAIYTALPIAVGTLPHFLSGMLTAALLARERAHDVTRTTLVAAVLSLLADALLVPRLGGIASGYVTLGISLFLLFSRLHATRRTVGVLLHTGHTLALLALDLLLLPLSLFLLPYPTVRLFLLLPLTLCLFPALTKAYRLLKEDAPRPNE